MSCFPSLHLSWAGELANGDSAVPVLSVLSVSTAAAAAKICWNSLIVTIADERQWLEELEIYPNGDGDILWAVTTPRVHGLIAAETTFERIFWLNDLHL